MFPSSLAVHCPTGLPFSVCRHWDALLYLAPSLAIAILLRLLARIHPLFFSLYLTGTFLHELAHLLLGWLSHARPAAMSLWPRRAGNGRWILGSVTFANIRWYNAAFVGLAPLLTLAVPASLAWLRQHADGAYGWADLLASALLAPVFLSFLPSRTDWLIALRSWPYAAAAAAWLWWIRA